MTLVRFFIKLFRSHGGPNQVALATALGVLVGIMPWYGYHTLVWLLLLLLFRLSPLAFMASLMVCKSLTAWLSLDQFCYTVGSYLLDQTSPRFVSWWQHFAALPGVALFELDRYVMFGSLILAFTGAVAIYFATRMLYRAIGKSKIGKKCKESQLAKSVAGFLWQNKPCEGNPFLRGRVICYFIVLLILALATLALLGNMLIKQAIQERGTAWLGVPVMAEDISYNLWENKLLLQGLTVRDPVADKTLLNIAWMELYFAPHGLRRGQLVFAKIMARDVTIRLVQNDKGEFNFVALRPLARNASYVSQVTADDWRALALDAESQKLIETTNLTWRAELRKWCLVQMAIARCKHRLRLTRIEEYGQAQQAPSDVLDALINLPTLQRTEAVLQEPPAQAKLNAGRPRYLARYRPWLVCQNLEIQGIKLEYSAPPNQSELYGYSLNMQNVAGTSLIREIVAQTLVELNKLEKK